MHYSAHVHLNFTFTGVANDFGCNFCVEHFSSIAINLNDDENDNNDIDYLDTIIYIFVCLFLDFSLVLQHGRIRR